MGWLFSRTNTDPRHAVADIDSEAMSLVQQGRYTEAELLYRRSLTILEQKLGLVHPYLVDSLNKLASVLSELGNHSEAIEVSERSLDIIEQQLGSESFEYAKGLNNLSLLLMENNNFSGAKHALQKSNAILMKILGSGHPDLAISQANLATLLYSHGSYSEAEPLFRATLLTLEQHFEEKHPSVLDARGNLASCLHRLGNYAEAKNLFENNLADRGKQLGQEHPDVALEQKKLADLFSSLGNFGEAIKHSFSSLKILEKCFGENHIQAAKSQEALGIHLGCTGKYAEAISYFQSSLNILKQHLAPSHLDVIRCRRNLSSSLLMLENYPEAERLCRDSLTILKKKLAPNSLEVAFALKDLGTVLSKSRKHDEAEPLFYRCLAILEQHIGSYHPDTSKTLMDLALLFDETDRTESAIFCAKRAVSILQKTRQNIFKIGEESLQLFDTSIESNYEQLADFLIKACRFGEAEYVMGMLKDAEFYDLCRRDEPCGIDEKLIPWNPAEKHHIEKLEKISATLTRMGEQINTLKKVRIKDRLPTQNKELADLEINIFEGYRKVSTFFHNLNLPEFKSTSIAENIVDLTDTAPNSVAVTTYSLPSGFKTVMKTKHGYSLFPSKCKSFDLSRKILKFRKLVKDPFSEPDEYLPLARELYDIIIRPMEKELVANNAKSIIWLLNGALRILPLAALHDGEQFMLEKFGNVCITAISSKKSAKSSSWTGLGMGVTRQHDDLDPLLMARDELEGIISMDGPSGVIPGKILLDEEFTKDSMKVCLKEGYKVAHFATHFVLSPANETMSYLLLGDGSKIRMDELRKFPRMFEGVDLVAFSACNTGLPSISFSGREVDGVGYLGELQGSNAVLATLWPVNDSSSSMLMREFYRVRQKGSPKSKALQKSQQALLHGVITSEDGHDFSHPYFWAPYVLIGNGC